VSILLDDIVHLIVSKVAPDLIKCKRNNNI